MPRVIVCVPSSAALILAAFALTLACSNDGGADEADAGSEDEVGEDSSDDADTTEDGTGEGSSESETDTGSTTDTESETDTTGGEPSEGLCQGLTPSTVPPGRSTAPDGPPPFAVGEHTNVTLGGLAGVEPVEAPVAPGAVDTGLDLGAATYDLRVPPSYDGEAPHGLIVFINSGNNGTLPSNGYANELDAGELLWIAPNDAGNSVNVDVRMGLAYLGTLWALEHYAIDRSRIYAMGSSGGARSANMLAYQYPQLYTGTLARCGANYPAQVAQDYETHEPDSHYEFWGPGFFPDVGGQPYLEHLRSFERRFALMTSFDDFREGDMMNIYHHGFEADDLFARFIETSGNHCASNEAHLRDGLGFVEHPLWRVVEDGFEDGELGVNAGLGDGLVDREGARGPAFEDGGALHLPAEPGAGPSAALIRNRTGWHDRHGLIWRAQLDFGDAPGGAAELGVLAHDPAVHGDDLSAAPVSVDEALGRPAIVLRVLPDPARVEVHVEVPSLGLSLEPFAAPIDDWTPADGPLGVKLEVWDRELQIDLDAHLGEVTALEGARVLDDGRTIRVRWRELLDGDEGWPASDWPASEGAVLSLAYTAGEAAGSLAVTSVRVEDALGLSCE